MQAPAEPPEPESASITIVIPAFNEAPAIGAVLEGLRARCGALVREIIVVDDGSTDATAEIARNSGARVLSNGKNRGYGASLKRGILECDSEFVLTMDGDGQHRPEDVELLCRAAPGHDMIVGQRTRLLHSPLWRMPGKWLLTRMARYLTREDIPDLNSGLRLFRKRVIQRYLHVCPAGFSFSTTTTLTMLSRKYRVTFLPIEVQARVGHSTVNFVTGLDTIILILRLAVLFNPLRVFIPASLLAAITGVGWGSVYMMQGRGLSVGALLALEVAIMLFALGLISDQISQLRLERYE